jgi:hypothetical protein
MCQAMDLDLNKKDKPEIFGKTYRELGPIKAASGLIKKQQQQQLTTKERKS